MINITKLLKNVVSILLLFSCLSIHSALATVLVSIKPIAFIASAITDGVTDVDILVPDGASPHNYTLKPSNIKALRSADLVIWVGEDMETFLPKIIHSLDEKKTLELMAQTSIYHELIKKNSPHLDEHDLHHHDNKANFHDNGLYNSHIWLDPYLAKLCAEEIHRKLVELFPKQSVKLDSNLADFLQKLNQTTENIKQSFHDVNDRGFFVFHDAYDYFNHYFGLNQLGYFVVNPMIQPSAKKVFEIQKVLKEGKAVCVFSEVQFNQNIIKKITQGTSVKMGLLDPLGVNIQVNKDSYFQFLSQLSQQFKDCLA